MDENGGLNSVYYYNIDFLTQNLIFQLCPDQPCGDGTTVGNGVTLPADGANGVDPCIAFSVGVDADTEKATEAKNCKGDLIRINGENHFFESILYHPVFQYSPLLLIQPC